MLQKVFLPVLLAGLFFSLQIRAGEHELDSKSKSSGQLIKKIVVSLPASIDEAAKANVIDKLTRLEQERFVYLDLSINSSSGSTDSVPYSLLINGKPSERHKGGCEIGALLMGQGVTYELGPINNYNHLLISIITGDRSQLPYNDVSCEYASGISTQFHIRGFFHVIANSIPTAVGLQLRPFNPPFERAVKVLAR